MTESQKFNEKKNVQQVNRKRLKTEREVRKLAPEAVLEKKPKNFQKSQNRKSRAGVGSQFVFGKFFAKPLFFWETVPQAC